MLFIDHLSALKRNMILRRLAKETAPEARRGDVAPCASRSWAVRTSPCRRLLGAARGGSRDRRGVLPAARSRPAAAMRCGPVRCRSRRNGSGCRCARRRGCATTRRRSAAFAALGLDAAVVAAYGLILPQAMLEAPRRGCLNIHASLLPRWRGAAPIQAAVLAGDTRDRRHHHADGCRAGHRADAAARGGADHRAQPPRRSCTTCWPRLGARLVLRALAEDSAGRCRSPRRAQPTRRS